MAHRFGIGDLARRGKNGGIFDISRFGIEAFLKFAKESDEAAFGQIGGA